MWLVSLDGEQRLGPALWSVAAAGKGRFAHAAGKVSGTSLLPSGPFTLVLGTAACTSATASLSASPLDCFCTWLACLEGEWRLRPAVWSAVAAAGKSRFVRAAGEAPGTALLPSEPFWMIVCLAAAGWSVVPADETFTDPLHAAADPP